jgi:hypothetical protein
MRHRQTKGAATDRLDLPAQDTCSLLYPDLPDLPSLDLHLRSAARPAAAAVETAV